MRCRVAGFVLLLIVGCGDGKQPDPDPAAEATKVKDAKVKIQALDQAVRIYYSQNGNWPASLEDLAKPSAGGKRLIKADALVDPWGKPFRYDPAGPSNGGEKPDIWTVAPGGKTIGNWQ
jgi:hypothetical protein